MSSLSRGARVGDVLGHGALVGLLASAGLVAERVEAGSTLLALLLLLTTFAVVSWVVSRLRALGPLRTSHAIAGLGGVVLGVIVMHAAVGMLGLVGPPLREAPAQLVNDLVLGCGLALLAWSVVARRTTTKVASALGVLALAQVYTATRARWHVDALVFPELTIQQFVAMQLGAVALGLLVLDWVTPREAR